jgi:hypothetical protein
MTKRPNQFGDGAAYERMMGRSSHLVGDKFLDWLDAPKGLRELREHLRAKLEPASVGRIIYEAFCNAVKRRAPG